MWDAEPHGKKLEGRIGRKWENNIKMKLINVGFISFYTLILSEEFIH
jgi:hypothetical protein